MVGQKKRDATFLFHFAPMEGITDEVYRGVVHRLYPLWEKVYTDFFRIPTSSSFSEKSLIKHLGEETYLSDQILKKTAFQILTTSNAQNEKASLLINELKIPHLDINLGCPSKKVNAHKGGAYLLQFPLEIKKLMLTYRKNYTGHLSVKLRSGFYDSSLLKEILCILKGEGADQITLHARTKQEMYKGKANWDLFSLAEKYLSPLPFIPNGDIWTQDDVYSLYNQYSFKVFMLARGATKNPWFPYLFAPYDRIVRKDKILEFFKELEQDYRNKEWPDEQILKRLKALSRYIFDDFNEGETLKKNFFRSQELPEAIETIHNFEEREVEQGIQKGLSLELK